MSEAIEEGRMHVITAIRQAWLLLASIGWIAWEQRGNIREAMDKLSVHSAPLAVAVLVLATVVVVSAPVFLTWRRTTFTMTTEHIEYRTGVLRHVTRRIPLARIRTVDVEQPLFGRPFGARTLKFGTLEEQEQLGYLTPRAARRLHDAVVMQTGAASARNEEGIVARVAPGTLALSMLLDLHTTLSLAAGLVGALIPYLIFDQPVGLALLLPWLRSAWRMTGQAFPRQYGWTIRETDAGYRCEGGLFNKWQYTWQAQHITSLTVHQPLLWRSRDWVKVTATAIGRSEGTVIPVASRAQAEKMVVRFFGPEALELLSHADPAPRRARWCTPWWRNCAFAWAGDYAAGWRGMFLRQFVTVAPLPRVASVGAEQGWWQRRHGLADVVLDFPAGGEVVAPHRDVEDAARLTARLREESVKHALAGKPIRRRTQAAAA